MSGEAKLLVVQFLRWIDERPRFHGDQQDAWQSTCPLNSAFEDAFAEGFVAYAADGRILLTARGKAALRGG